MECFLILVHLLKTLLSTRIKQYVIIHLQAKMFYIRGNNKNEQNCTTFVLYTLKAPFMNIVTFAANVDQDQAAQNVQPDL